MAAVEELMTNNIANWALAVQKRTATGRGSGKKVELYGIKKLRELILELAVQGKLVPQNLNDQSASLLLEKTEIQERGIVKLGRGAAVDLDKAVEDIEKPFELPSGWEWVRLGKILEITGGSQPPKSVFKDSPQEGYTRLIQIRDFKSDEYPTYVPNEYANRPFVETDIMIGRYGPPVFQILRGKSGTYNVALMKADAIAETISKDFLFYLLSEPRIQKVVIGESERTAGQSGVRKELLYTFVIALPPLEEQARIADKIVELMSLCDQLEQQTESSLTAHATLVENLLATLTSSTDAAELEQNWQRIAEHFTTLFTTEESIDQLKQTVLQLAVMGKLVPQNPNDEPASVLLEKIASEKAQLIKDKRIPRSTPLPEVTEEEKPFELPAGWSLARLGNLTSKLGSGSTPRGGKNAYVETGIPFLRSQNVWNDGLRLNDIAYIPEDTHQKMEKTKVFPGDVLLNITGASLGRSTIFPENLIEANVSQHVTIIRLVEKEMRRFIHLGIQSPMVQKLVWGRQVGMAIEGLSKKVLEMFEFPIPPIEEQHRIVARVEELMAICDQLKTHLQQAQQTRLHLADAMVEEALA